MCEKVSSIGSVSTIGSMYNALKRTIVLSWKVVFEGNYTIQQKLMSRSTTTDNTPTYTMCQVYDCTTFRNPVTFGTLGGGSDQEAEHRSRKIDDMMCDNSAETQACTSWSFLWVLWRVFQGNFIPGVEQMSYGKPMGYPWESHGSPTDDP